MKTETYIVRRHHLGDKHYAEGDERTANPQEVAHLVDRGILEKKAKKAKNKAEPKAKNKAAK